MTQFKNLLLPCLLVLCTASLMTGCAEETVETAMEETSVVDLVDEQDQCLICHMDPVIKVKYKALFDYYIEYEQTAHGKAGLSCVSCHGGNPEAEDREAGHEGIELRMTLAQVPDTCGKCHAIQFSAFTSGEAHVGLEADADTPVCPNCGDAAMPVCTHCHGSMKMELMPAQTVLPRCIACHPINSEVPGDVGTDTERVLGLMAEISVARDQLESSGADEVIVDEIESAFQTLTWHWHRFDLEQAEAASVELLARLDTVLADAQADSE